MFLCVCVFCVIQVQAAEVESDTLAGEATANIRTVAAFTCEDHMLEQYSEALVAPLKVC